MAIRSGLATLFADATIAQFRCHGLHRELIAARLNEAIAQGCDLATASTAPGAYRSATTSAPVSRWSLPR